MPRSTDPDFVETVRRAKQIMATFADMEELIRLGAYRQGSSPEVDEAIRLNPAFEAFLRQGKEEFTSLRDGYLRLAEIVSGEGGLAAPPVGPTGERSEEFMKSRDTLIRLKRFQVDEKRRQVTQIETMIAEFERMANDLDREIKTEEQRAGITDTSHFAYPTYAKAAMVRRDNLRGSANDLKDKLDGRQGSARRGVRGAQEGRDPRGSREGHGARGSRRSATRRRWTVSASSRIQPPGLSCDRRAELRLSDR